MFAKERESCLQGQSGNQPPNESYVGNTLLVAKSFSSFPFKRLAWWYHKALTGQGSNITKHAQLVVEVQMRLNINLLTHNPSDLNHMRTSSWTFRRIC